MNYRGNHKENASPRIAVLCGPTGVGKTKVALEIAGSLNAEIVSADSMQVYRYMDIGTAKPSAHELERIQHHLINVIDPDEPFDVQHFMRMSHHIISRLVNRNIPVLVVGGTGLYIRVLIHGLFDSVRADPEVRARIKEEALLKGSDGLYRRLLDCDPKAASRIHPHDTYRIIRAIEVYETTGQNISDYHQKHQFENSFFDSLIIGLYREREVLYTRINSRVDMMIQDGLANEVNTLLDKGYASTIKPMQSIGYRHMGDYLAGRLSWDKAIQTLKQDTRRYAKRQLTWFNSDSQLEWIDADHLDEVYKRIKAFLQPSQFTID